MQKLSLPLLFVLTFVTATKAQQRLFDQPVQLRTCNISIEANHFIATTIIEMEFYNPKDQEVEGYQRFDLNRGQVITDFQLELNGKYREGSIEERWKARQAYSSIVGKRIDPALLQMNGQNSYSLNIYPIAAKSSRKIKFTITQMMLEEKLKLSYTLPLNFKSTTANFKVDIKINDPATIPYSNNGFLVDQLFNMGDHVANLSWQATDIILNRDITFSITQFANLPQFCISKTNGKTNFLMRYYPDVVRYYPSKPGSINVYWDVSLSGKSRDLKKELDFLESYITENEIGKTTIILFNHELQGVIVYNRVKDSFRPIRSYLLSYKYSGATDLGNLNFSNVLADAVLLFSDGINSIGNGQPKLGAVQVNLITSAYRYNYNAFKNIIGNTGGSVISLNNTEVKNAVKRIDSAENFLFRYTSNNIHINETFPIKLGGSVLLSGSIDQSDNLELFYGNNTSTFRSENYFLPAGHNCDDATYKKMQMLKTYDSLMYGYYYNYYDWKKMVVFGLTEKVVTPQTSYLVLERIEDYIKYKIAPPKELEEKCAELNYVYRSEYKIKALKEFTEQETLESVVKNYNKRISWWDKNETLIDLDRQAPDIKNNDIVANPSPQQRDKTVSSNEMLTNFKPGATSDLKEVVVSGGYGIKRSLKTSSTNVQVVAHDQLNTIRNTNINEALAGKVAGIQLRGQSGAKLGSVGLIRLHGVNSLMGNTKLLYVLDGTRVDAEDINVDDVEDVTVLQGPAAAAIYGPDGANGAFVVTSKKARKRYYSSYAVWGEYKLSKAEDEDYIQQLKKAAAYELWETWLGLEKENENNIGFYFETADLFFEKGKTDKAQEILYNAIELCNGNSNGLKLAAYIYEKWKCFDKAIAVYQGIISLNENDLAVKRDLALAYFQNKNYETAVKTYYKVITAADNDNEYSNIRECALAEMNSVIVLHKNEFDISYINHNLVKALPVDLRIAVETNYDQINNLQIIEPGNTVCNYTSKNTVNGGSFMGEYNYMYLRVINEYAIRNAVPGKYRIKVNSNNNYSYDGSIPVVARVIVFKNFQKDNMEIEVKNFNLANQYGVIELDEIRW